MTLTSDAPEQVAAVEQQDAPAPVVEQEQQPELSPHQQKMARLREELLGAESGEPEEEDEDGVPAGEPVGAGEAEDDEGEGEGEDGGLVTLEFPGRMEGDAPFAVPIDRAWLEEQGLSIQDVVERHRQLVNGYGRRTAIRAERDQLEQERQQFHQEIEKVRQNPARFVAQEVPADQRAQVVEAILLGLDDAAYRQVATKVDRWARDSRARQAERERAELEDLRGQHQHQEQDAKAEAIATNAREVATAVTALIPEDMDDNRARLFFNAAVAELVRHGRTNNLEILDPATVPQLLAQVGVLEVYGLGANGSSSSAGSPHSNGTPPAASAPAGRTPSGQGDARDRMTRRKNAVAAPAGASSSVAAGFQKVQGERHIDRRNRLAKALGLPQKKDL